MQLYLIRHAQSANNALADERQRVRDPHLTALGHEQTRLLAQAFRAGHPLLVDAQGHPQKFTHLYCSPMWRSLQTAQPLAQVLGLTPEVWVDVHEQGGIYLEHGEPQGTVGYPGATRSEILASFADYTLPEHITDEGWWRFGYEDIPECCTRAARVAEMLRRRAPLDERLAIVTHGTFMDILLKVLTNQEPNNKAFHYYHHNTAITCLEFAPDGRFLIYALNWMNHLPPELIS